MEGHGSGWWGMGRCGARARGQGASVSSSVLRCVPGDRSQQASGSLAPLSHQPCHLQNGFGTQ